MSNKKSIVAGKPAWERPQLVKLGTIRDIAGRAGNGIQSGPNTRAFNS